MFNVKKIRKDFPILAKKVNGKPLVYLDNSATTQKPKQVIAALNDYYKGYNSNIHRGLNSLSIKATKEYEAAHEKVAEFINAESMEEIIFLKNATEGLNLLANCVSKTFLKEGDEVLLSKMEHHSNFVPWLMLSKERNLKLKFIDVKADGTLNLENLDELLKNTKVVAITHCSNVLGTINPVQEIVRKAHSIGALVILDAAQSIPHMPIDVKKLDVDFLAFSGHKMLGPTGIGVVYGKKELLERMVPFLYGGDMISEVYVDRASWNKLPWKYEAGTPNIAGAIGLMAAIEYLQKLGMKNIQKYEQSLAKYALKTLGKIEGIQIYGPEAEKKAAVFSFNVNGIHPHDVATILDREGVEIRAGDHCAQPLMRELGIIGAARASFYIYNTKEEIDKLAAGIEKAKKIFKV